MEIYLSIIKCFLDKGTYETYKEYVDVLFLRQNFPEVLKVFHTLEELHKLGIESPSIGDLEVCFHTAYPKADRMVFDPLFGRIRGCEINPKSISSYLETLEQKESASKLAFKLLEYVEGRNTEGLDITTLVGNFHDKLQSKENEPKTEANTFVDDDIEILYNNAVALPGLNWRLKSLRRSLGPIRRGDMGFIFARPETGKTTFLASEVSYMAGQGDDSPVLWFNNEEAGDKVLLRCYEACLGAPLEQIIANKDRARKVFYERTRRCIKIRDDAGITRKAIEQLCRQYKPKLIVVDQLDKVKGFAADREDLLLGAIYQWSRELSKEFAPLIGVSQSDGSGEGIKYLTMGNVANAKTAKQAEADWILGIGVSYADPPNVRGMSICKNKLIGGEETQHTMRHGKWDVLIRPELARYQDIGEVNE